MKKTVKICNIIAFLLLVGFFPKLGRDWMMYNSSLNSAPFYIWVVADAVQYLLPAALTFLIGRFLKSGQNNKTKNDSDFVR